MCGGSAKDLKIVAALGERSDTRRHQRWQVYQFGHQNQTDAGLPVWVSKSGVRPVRSNDSCGGHVTSSRSLHRDEAKSWRRCVRPVLREKLKQFYPWGVFAYVLHVRVCVEGCGDLALCFSHLEVLSLFLREFVLGLEEWFLFKFFLPSSFNCC